MPDYLSSIARELQNGGIRGTDYDVAELFDDARVDLQPANRPVYSADEAFGRGDGVLVDLKADGLNVRDRP
tara:strand:- start:803 stop:1015 length:213 start_codon:yes stop_codon:yes gene_type:complete